MKRILIRFHDPYNFGWKRWTATMIDHDGYHGRPFYVGGNHCTLDDLCNYLKKRRTEYEDRRKRK